jgi:hypothetical protein
MALLSICILYGVGRLLMPERYAIAAVFIIALNPGQLWVTHMTLTEIFAQVSIWSGLLILCYALKTEDSRFAMWAGIILGLSLWIRIDSFLLIPFFFLSHLMYRIATRNDGSQREHIWLSFYKSGLLMFLAGALFNVFTTLPYIIGISSQLRLADRLMIATAVLLLLIVPKIQDYIQRFLRYRATFVVLAGIVSLLTIYAYGIRPRVQPFNISFMPNGVSMRDYRENSLVNIAKYLSPLIVFSAPIGLLVMYWNIFKKKTDHHLVAAVLISIGMSIAYLWNPSIVPDHFWAIRRFIPVSIPGFVLFAGIGISWLLGRYIPRFGRYVAVGLLIFFVVFLVKADLLQMSVQEDEGIYDQLKGLAEKLPENKTILSDNNGTWAIWETPMYIAFDRKVIPLDIDQNPGRQIAQMWLSHKNNPNDTRYLAYETSKDLGGLKIKSMKEVELKMSFLEHSYDHLPEKTNEGAWDVQIFEVSSVVDNFMGYQLGGKPYDGVDESGFYNSEDNGRWTNGSGSLTIPIKPGYRPDSLRVNLASTGPLGTTLNIVANHIELLKKKLPAAGWSGVMSLGQVPINDELEIEVNSDRFTPAKILPNNSDSRTLGVMVKSVILLGNKDLISGRPLGDSGYHSMLRIDRLDTQKPIGSDKGISFELTVLNTGNIPWLSFSELGSYRGAVRVGILWRSKSDSLKPVLEQRAELPGILQPGEESRFSISLVPLDGRGKRLSPGEYEIWVGMLQEGVVWFYTKGDTLVKIPIEVENN